MKRQKSLKIISFLLVLSFIGLIFSQGMAYAQFTGKSWRIGGGSYGGCRNGVCRSPQQKPTQQRESPPLPQKSDASAGSQERGQPSYRGGITNRVVEIGDFKSIASAPAQKYTQHNLADLDAVMSPDSTRQTVDLKDIYLGNQSNLQGRPAPNVEGGVTYTDIFYDQENDTTVAKASYLSTTKNVISWAAANLEGVPEVRPAAATSDLLPEESAVGSVSDNSSLPLSSMEKFIQRSMAGPKEIILNPPQEVTLSSPSDNSLLPAIERLSQLVSNPATKPAQISLVRVSENAGATEEILIRFNRNLNGTYDFRPQSVGKLEDLPKNFGVVIRLGDVAPSARPGGLPLLNFNGPGERLGLVARREFIELMEGKIKQ